MAMISNNIRIMLIVYYLMFNTVIQTFAFAVFILFTIPISNRFSSGLVGKSTCRRFSDSRKTRP